MESFTKLRIFISTIIIGLAGTGLHFVYKLSGKSAIVGLIASVNESVWEHTKLAFIPMMIFWLILIFFQKKGQINHGPKAAVSGIFSTIISIIFIPLFFYTYSEGLGIHSLALDISFFYICILIGQAIGAHIYNRTTPPPIAGIIAIASFIALFIIYAIFTFNPPNIPIFISPI
ncbi:MAG: DUF6512 family protein [Bacillota bacterium]